MLWLVRRLARLRGPAGVVALATGVGLLTGMVAAHAVLAAWTYRDASRRDLREPGRWALVVLVGGLVGFVAYVAVQRAAGLRAMLPGGRPDEGRVGAREDDDAADGPADDEASGDDAPPASGGEPSPRAEVPEALPAAGRYGLRAARLGVRGARWAGRRAAARMNNR